MSRSNGSPRPTPFGAPPPIPARQYDFRQGPMLVYWEVTTACDLACQHCRANAQVWRHPQELSRDEGYRLLEQLAEFDPKPHIVFTGGDPLKHPDLFLWIERAVQMGFLAAVTPAGTPLLTREVIQRFKDAGVWMLSVSLDGSTAERHDAVRMVEGSFERTVNAIRWALEVGLPVQVNSLVARMTYDDIPAIGHLLAELGVQRWSVFFLVPVGRGKILGAVTAEQTEHLLEWLYDFSKTAPFAIKTTEAHHYRRVALQKATAEGNRRRLQALRRGFGIRDGSGILFISHIGEITPAGFLPIVVGNVRTDHVVQVYREHPLFVALRNPDGYQGKCGVCEYRKVCGGSRAQAYAYTGDPLGSDPTCVYIPEKARVA